LLISAKQLKTATADEKVGLKYQNDGKSNISYALTSTPVRSLDRASKLTPPSGDPLISVLVPSLDTCEQPNPLVVLSVQFTNINYYLRNTLSDNGGFALVHIKLHARYKHLRLNQANRERTVQMAV